MDEIDLTVETDEPPQSMLMIAFPEASMAALSATQRVTATLDLDEVGYERLRYSSTVNPS